MCVSICTSHTVPGFVWIINPFEERADSDSKAGGLLTRLTDCSEPFSDVLVAVSWEFLTPVQFKDGQGFVVVQ